MASLYHRGSLCCWVILTNCPANRPLPALYIPIIPGPNILQRDHAGKVILFLYFLSLSFEHLPPSSSFLFLNSSPMSQSCKLYKVSSHLSNGVVVLSSHFHCWIISHPLTSSRFPNFYVVPSRPYQVIQVICTRHTKNLQVAHPNAPHMHI